MLRVYNALKACFWDLVNQVIAPLLYFNYLVHIASVTKFKPERLDVFHYFYIPDREHHTLPHFPSDD